MNSSLQNVHYVHGRTVDAMGDKGIENVISATQELRRGQNLIIILLFRNIQGSFASVGLN